jgi:[ribosomal protein S5]-alanine N-acetyltransferase
MASIGYWLGEPFWGRGFAISAVKTISDYAYEGRMRKSILKDGRIADMLLYARLRA